MQKFLKIHGKFKKYGFRTIFENIFQKICQNKFLEKNLKNCQIIFQKKNCENFKINKKFSSNFLKRNNFWLLSKKFNDLNF